MWNPLRMVELDTAKNLFNFFKHRFYSIVKATYIIVLMEWKCWQDFLYWKKRIWRERNKGKYTQLNKMTRGKLLGNHNPCSSFTISIACTFEANVSQKVISISSIISAWSGLLRKKDSSFNARYLLGQWLIHLTSWSTAIRSVCFLEWIICLFSI